MPSETGYIKSKDIRSKINNGEKLTKAELNSLAFAGYKLLEEHPRHPKKESFFWTEGEKIAERESAKEEVKLNPKYKYLNKSKKFAWMLSSVSIAVPIMISIADHNFFNISTYAAPATLSAAALSTAYVSNYFAENKIIKNPSMHKTGGGIRDMYDPPIKYPVTDYDVMFYMQNKMQKIHDKLKDGFGLTRRRMIKKMIKEDKEKPEIRQKPEIGQKIKIILDYKKEIESKRDDGFPTHYGFRTKEEGYPLKAIEAKKYRDKSDGWFLIAENTTSPTHDENNMDSRSDKKKMRDEENKRQAAIAKSKRLRADTWNKIWKERKEKEALENAKKNEKRSGLLGKINEMKKNMGMDKSENNYTNNKP